MAKNNNKLSDIVASAVELDDKTKIALGTAALNLATLEWVSGKYTTFICEKLHINANDLELCATYIYVQSADTMAEGKVDQQNADVEIDVAAQYVTPELINKLARNNNAISRFSKEISATAQEVDLSSIIVPAFEISFMWLEQLTNNVIIDTLRSTCNLNNIEDIDTNLFIYSYIGLVDGISCVDEVFGAGTLTKLQLHNIQQTATSSIFFQDTLEQAREWYNSLPKKQRKQYSFNSK